MPGTRRAPDSVRIPKSKTPAPLRETQHPRETQHRPRLWRSLDRVKRSLRPTATQKLVDFHEPRRAPGSYKAERLGL